MRRETAKQRAQRLYAQIPKAPFVAELMGRREGKWLLITNDPREFQPALTWAMSDGGFSVDDIRCDYWDGSPPNFAATVNI